MYDNSSCLLDPGGLILALRLVVLGKAYGLPAADEDSAAIPAVGHEELSDAALATGRRGCQGQSLETMREERHKARAPIPQTLLSRRLHPLRVRPYEGIPHRRADEVLFLPHRQGSNTAGDLRGPLRVGSVQEHRQALRDVVDATRAPMPVEDAGEEAKVVEIVGHQAVLVRSTAADAGLHAALEAFLQISVGDRLHVYASIRTAGGVGVLKVDELVAHARAVHKTAKGGRHEILVPCAAHRHKEFATVVAVDNTYLPPAAIPPHPAQVPHILRPLPPCWCPHR
mmetsp:Transcript_132412/g.295266  ORF Transcript_132412/g.295266 Transcript_132412/m.295266 type:complete len:284 (+) Transcript_132412:289-1140(+)